VILLLFTTITVANAFSALFNNIVGVVLNSYSLAHLLHVPIRSMIGEVRRLPWSWSP
jgi:hypothetical protein